MRRFLFLFSLCLIIYPALGFAKSSSYDALFFKPATDMNLYLGVYGADNLDQWDYTFGLMADYAQDPIKSFTAAGANIREVIGPIFVGNLYGSIGLLPFLSAGIVFPIVPLEKFRDPTTGARSDNFELGDLRFDLKVKLLDHYRFPIGLAFVPFVTAPTGSDTHLTGNGKFTGGGLLVIDSPRLFDRLSLSLNTGYQIRNQTTVVSGTTIDDQLLYGVGVNLAVVRWMDLILDAHGTTQANNIFQKTAQSPFETDGALRFYFEKVKLAATVGGGVGVTKGVGAPSYRVLAGLSFMTPRPYGAAEYSLYEFKVPPEAVYELSQKCPYSQGEFDPNQDNPQCEEVYVLRELASDCPEEALYDPKKDNPNCARVYVYEEQDRDHDGISDYRDQCPDEAETVNGHQDDDGCPDTGRAVSFTEDELVSQRIFFDFNKASLKPTSQETLQEVAQAMVEHTEIQKFEIRGHTDNVGTPAFNKVLSLKRANAVREFLIEEGVDKSRLTAKGLGSTRPILSNKTESGRAKNRRVEFIIIKDGKTFGPGKLEKEEKREESRPSVETVPPTSETAPQEEIPEEPDLLVR